MYVVENYKDNKRFNSQYNEICRFLKISADRDYNEHFHWGRFAWMIAALIPLLVKFSSVPVGTIVIPARGSFAAATFSVGFSMSSSLSRFSHSARLF